LLEQLLSKEVDDVSTQQPQSVEELRKENEGLKKEIRELRKEKDQQNQQIDQLKKQNEEQARKIKELDVLHASKK